MRIRSIRPEFWTSQDIARLNWNERLIFIGLWSYVDDNGVGRDVEKLIKADLFPLEDDPHGALMQVAGALMSLETGGQVCRYEVDGKPLFHICSWDSHQIISRPSKGRYTRLTCADAARAPSTHVNDMSPHANSPLGEGEKGRRGEGETPLSDKSDQADRFDEFWDTYSHKLGRKKAETAYRAALKKPGITADLLITAAGAYITWQQAGGKHPQFTKHAATWLAGEHWRDEWSARQAPMTRVQEHLALAQEMAASEQATTPQIGARR